MTTQSSPWTAPYWWMRLPLCISHSRVGLWLLPCAGWYAFGSERMQRCGVWLCLEGQG